MRASTVMLVAIGVAIVGRWAHNKPFQAKDVVGAGFALFVITVADAGKTAPIAKGFAWLFLAAVVLGNDSPLTGISRIVNGMPTPRPAVGKNNA